MEIKNFSCLEELIKFLDEHGIHHQVWSHNCCDVGTLFRETKLGECTIWYDPTTGRVTRMIRVTSLSVYAFMRTKAFKDYGWFVLREVKHVHKTGKIIERGYLPYSLSEKMLPGETPEQAAVRALKVELGWTNPHHFHLDSSNEKRGPTNCLVKDSYVGIVNVVEEQHVIKCLAQKLIQNENGYSTDVGDKTIFFEWFRLPAGAPTIPLPESSTHRAGSS